MKKITLTFCLILAMTLAVASCGSDDSNSESSNTTTKKSSSKSGDAKTEKKSAIPNPCEIVEFSDIQAVMAQPQSSERGEKGKYFDGGSTQYCSWEAADSPFSSIEIRVGKNGESGNDIATSKAIAKDGFEIDLGDEAWVDPKLQVINFVVGDAFFAVQAVANTKDFSSESNIPEELKIEGSSIAGSSIQSNLIAEYLISKKIVAAL